MASPVPSSLPATYAVSTAYRLPSQPQTLPASAKSFPCPAFISRNSFSPPLRLISCLALRWGFRKHAHSLPLWENKDSATVVFRAAHSAEGFYRVGGRSNAIAQNKILWLNETTHLNDGRLSSRRFPCRTSFFSLALRSSPGPWLHLHAFWHRHGAVAPGPAAAR